MCALYYLGYGQCYVCGATATQMSEPRGSLHAFIPKPGTLGLGFHPLHVEMNSFRWACKAAFNQDFRDWRVSGIYYVVSIYDHEYGFTAEKKRMPNNVKLLKLITNN